MEFEYEIEEIYDDRCKDNHKTSLKYPYYKVTAKKPPKMLYCCQLLAESSSGAYDEYIFITAEPFDIIENSKPAPSLALQTRCIYGDEYGYSRIQYCPFCGEKLSYTSTTKKRRIGETNE